MASWTTATLPAKHLPVLPVVAYHSFPASVPCYRKCYSGLGLLRKDIFTGDNSLKVASSFTGRGRINSLESHDKELWEDPDDGSETEYENEEDAEDGENDFDFESDWEEEKGTPVSVLNVEETIMEHEDNIIKEVVKLLEPEEQAILLQNATPNIEKISTEKWKPMHTLALSGQINFFDDLLEHGLDIDLADNDGRTSLHVAVMGKKEAVISHLLRKGANPHVKDKDGATALHYAVEVGAIQTVKLLIIKCNADVNASDNDGWTPSHVAMQCRNRNIAKVLLINGADITRKNKDGKTPLDLCLAYGKDFKSYDLAHLLKLIPANRNV